MYRYIALGDSITAGYSATGPARAYPSRVVTMLCEHRCIASGDILAEAGWTSADLNAAVLGDFPGPLPAANAISVWVGGDDLVDAAFAMLARGSAASAKTIVPMTLKRYGRDLTAMITAIRRVSKAKLILCTQYNPFPNSPLAAEAVASLNSVTATVASQTGCVLAPVHAWFSGQEARLIAGYRSGRIEDALRGNPAVHPNNRGHLVIAENLTPLVGTRW
ncbi:SGNH/GDSL hydrolase family protein [Alicyclobacillus curvatus]|nr:SGNH/GDSL hydrolase family protein [Alicyclobacillus curvatus]